MLQRLGAGLVASGLAAVLVKLVGALHPIAPQTAQALNWQEMPLFALPAEPDPQAEAIMTQFIQDWGAKGATTGSQGVWIQSGMSRLAKHQGTVPLPAASLTKIATTLAALGKWGPAHRFETLVSTTGRIENGVLRGDLVVTGSGDPFFVWEEAIALGNSLNEMGIRRVTGNLIVADNFYMNYKEDPTESGQLLREAINTETWSAQATAQHGAMPEGTPKPQVVVAGDVRAASASPSRTKPLLRHHSMTLAQILREMNVYSNNAMAEMLAQSVGGAQATAKLAAEAAGVPSAEILLVNGSGLGVENRVSPRAAAAMLMTVERILQSHQIGITDLFPVSGRDERGTMLARNIPEGAAVKTGTLRDVSALAGVLPTRDRDRVWFAIINRGGDIEGFRAQQDELLARLTETWGSPPAVNTGVTQPPERLGDPQRNVPVNQTASRF